MHIVNAEGDRGDQRGQTDRQTDFEGRVFSCAPPFPCRTLKLGRYEPALQNPFSNSDCFIWLKYIFFYISLD